MVGGAGFLDVSRRDLRLCEPECDTDADRDQGGDDHAHPHESVSRVAQRTLVTRRNIFELSHPYTVAVGWVAVYRSAIWLVAALVCASACGDDYTPLTTAKPGVVFTYPYNSQLDVPVGTHVVAVFSEPVAQSAIGTCTAQGGGFCLVGPNGPVTATPTVGADGKTVTLTGLALDPGTQYQLFVGAALDPQAQNLPASGPLLKFTTRNDRPVSAVPTLVAVNGGDPTNPESFRPLLDTSTIRLVFSEPLDPRSVMLAAGSIQLLDANGQDVPATLYHEGIHVSIDPKDDLTPGAMYKLVIGTQLVDLSGQPAMAATIVLTPQDSKGTSGPIAQKLRTRVMGDPGTASPRTAAMTNTIVNEKPLIGTATSTVAPTVLATELADPKALGGPIAFVLRKGQRIKASSIDIALGGAIPLGLTTGDVWIELLTDANGRMYRNPNQAADQNPENDRAPLYVDLTMDIAVYAADPKGNAALAQTVLGVQGGGIVTATEGVLDIEQVASMDLGLLGVTSAASNMVLELITDLKAADPPADTAPPMLMGTLPDAGTELLAPDGGIELIFDEPIDIDRARNGGIVLQDNAGKPVVTVIESHGSVVVVRPRAPLPNASTFNVVLTDVADLAGNKAPAAPPIQMSTPPVASTQVPMTVSAVYPGAPCALTGGTAASPGRCTGGQSGDDMYSPFSLPANEHVYIGFTQPVHQASAVLGTMCNSGSVRVEEIDSTGACVNAVPGALVRHDRSLEFFPDAPWTVGKTYRLSLISGGSSSCGTGVLCGLVSAASLDPLNGTGTGAGGGPNGSFVFTGAPANDSTFLVNEASPATDVNGSGFVDGNEIPRDENRAQVQIIGTSGVVSSANFNGPDCPGSTDNSKACIFVSGLMPVEMQAVQQNCTLPDGSTAPTCMPVAIPAEAMYGTSISMSAQVVISLTNDTGTSVMRVRPPAGGGPVIGYVITQNGGPELVVWLDLYMDAPDLSLPLGTTHDLHSKPLTLKLQGPVTNLADGRISISVSNIEDVPLTVNISTIAGNGAVMMNIAKGDMKLQLLSPPLRGALL